MDAQIISGKELAHKVEKEVADEIAILQKNNKRQPGLAVVLVGNDPGSEVYVRNKRKSCERVGILSSEYKYDTSITEQELLDLIYKLNGDNSIDGILVQLPLPKHINEEKIIQAINPQKDVDGFHPFNIGNLCLKTPTLRACTPYGIIQLLNTTNVELRGKHAVIVGASIIVGRPLALELLLKDCTVTVAHEYTENLASLVKQADILVVAVGKANLIPGNWLKKGSIVIDVGINRLENNKLVGDVNFAEAKEKAAFITPVPGGVGPMTVATLMQNTLYAYKHYHANNF